MAAYFRVQMPMEKIFSLAWKEIMEVHPAGMYGNKTVKINKHKYFKRNFRVSSSYICILSYNQ